MSWDNNVDAPTALTVEQRSEIFSLPEVVQMMHRQEDVRLFATISVFISSDIFILN